MNGLFKNRGENVFVVDGSGGNANLKIERGILAIAKGSTNSINISLGTFSTMDGAIMATDGGENLIDANTIDIRAFLTTREIFGKFSQGRGITTENGSNTINASNITISSKAEGIYTKSGKNLITASKTLNLTSTNSQGIASNSGGTNVINAANLNINTLLSGIYSDSGGINKITLTDQLNILSTGSRGIFVFNGKSTIQAKNIIINAKNEGIYTRTGTSTLNLTGDLDIRSTTSKGIFTEGGSTELQAKDIIINTIEEGIYTKSGTSTLNLTGKLDIHSTTSTGIANNGGTNIINADSLNIITQKRGISNNTGTNRITISAQESPSNILNVYAENGFNDIIFGIRTSDNKASISTGAQKISIGGIDTDNGTNRVVFATYGDVTIRSFNLYDYLNGYAIYNAYNGNKSSYNNIDFYGKGENIIDGSIKAGNTSSVATKISKQNNITFHSGSKNLINGSIIADGSENIEGVNNITFRQDLKEAKILGDISASNTGKNNITLSSASNTLRGNINAYNGGNNNILIQNDSILDSKITTTGNSKNNIIVDGVWLSDSNTSGSITASGGLTNVVVRSDISSPDVSHASLSHTLLLSQTASLNLVSQFDNINTTNVAQILHINYQPNTTANLIFANSNDMYDSSNYGKDDFSASATNVSENKILGVTYKDGIKLTIEDKKVQIGDLKDQSFIAQYEKYYTDNPYLLNLEITRSKTQDDVIIKGLVTGNIYSLENGTQAADKHFNITLNKDSIFAGSTSLANSSIKINLTMQPNAKIFLVGSNRLDVKNLTINANQLNTDALLLNSFEQKNTIIDIASDGNDLGAIPTRSDFRLLSIGNNTDATGLSGNNTLFRVYMNANATNATMANQPANNNETYGYAYSDRVIVLSGTKGTHYLQVIADNNTDISTIKYHGGGSETEGNIAVATIKKDSNVSFIGANQLQGFDLVGTTLTTQTTDENGKYNNGGDYTTYFVDSMTSKGASTSNQDASFTALNTNYVLYLANINSLNKRMGELRENANSQGAWARIFNGMQTSNFSLETKALYTTFQAGYDYAFGFSGANNYLGFALSYANSLTSSNSSIDIDGSSKGIKDVTSNAIEFAIYNAYVQDGASKATGWKNGLY
ncbi:hypothetical protein CQA57_07535, partial [Helicobacter anseris]